MASRRRAREVVVQVLFQRDLNPGSDYDTEHKFVQGRLKHDARFVDFAMSLLRGIESNQQGIDDALSRTSQNWKLGRMAATDRAIMRLATFEILFFESTPGPVAINEAIELAKRYGTNNSSQFVNGVLDRMLNQPHAANETTDPAEAQLSDQVVESDGSSAQELPDNRDSTQTEPDKA